jgi:hypothetical protein
MNRLVAGTLLAASVLLEALVLPAPARAQGAAEALFEECASGQGAEMQALCADATMALQALHGGVGLLFTVGGPIPASPSTAGRRAPGTPRLVFDGGVTLARFNHPSLASPLPATGDAGRESSVAGGRFAAAMGIYDGFSPLPTVGGVLALDLVAAVRLIRIPDSPSSTGHRVGWGAGARVGLFRESFSLPGVTFSAVRYGSGSIRYGVSSGEGALVQLEPSVTSYRLVAGKDLWPVGVSAGIGWDQYRGSGRFEVRVDEGGGAPTTARAAGGLHMNREYLFAGLNYTWLVTQVAAELTWADRASPLAVLEGTGDFRPGGRELQGTVTFRLIY